MCVVPGEPPLCAASVESSLVVVREFWEEEQFNEKSEMRRFFTKWGIVFAALVAFAVFALWWAGSALSFSASRVTEGGKASYRVFGVVTDSRSGAPVPWAKIQDDPEKRPPLFETSADFYGKFELMTLPEPHNIVIAAYGHKPKRVAIGKTWYLWLPSGTEEIKVSLDPE